VSYTLGLFVESLVAMLLMLTIGYCIVLNRRLKRLRADEQSLRATISELITATEIAERAIGGLKLTVRECDQKLGNQLAGADEMADRLKKHTLAGEAVLFRLSRIALAARPILDRPAEKAGNSGGDERPGARSIVQAAHAFAERRRANGIAA
jgi:hypothetical protein